VNKRAPNGRFVSVLCEVCQDEGRVLCPRCAGSGEGMVDGSRCMECKGSGSVPCPGEVHEEV